MIAAVPACVDHVICVDDACPEGSGDTIVGAVADPRLEILRHATNTGVGGAMVSGYRRALELGADIVVKIDGDGQMDPALLPRFIAPILAGSCDYTKGNRFFNPRDLQGMPPVRLIGNALLGLLNKVSTGYWNILDPTNGYTAIHGKVLARVPLDRLSRDFFFESDMLFQLSLVRAVVRDVPMAAVYGDGGSTLRIRKVVGPFLVRLLGNFVRRFYFNYVLRDFNIATIETVFGVVLTAFGLVIGLDRWAASVRTGTVATAGTVMLSALPLILGFQLLLSAISYDIGNIPRTPLHPSL